MADPQRLPPKNPGPLRYTTELRDAGRGGSHVEFPPDLAKALEADAAAKDGWEKFSYSHQREYATAILEAKREETRAKRVAEAARAAREKSQA